MMGLGTDFANDILQLLLNAQPIANVADNAATSPITNIYCALHTADPSAGDQTSYEASYTGYSRVALSRDSGGWSIVGEVASPVAAVNFGKCTANPGAALTYASFGMQSAGASEVIFSGLLSPAITMLVGVQPQIPTTATITLS